MKSAVYLRQSEDRDDTQLAISRQREDCHRLCADRGWEPVDYVDNDTSAVGGKKRPAWEQMLTDIETGAVQAVVCWDLDRLYREPIDLEKLIPLADRKGIALATVSGDVDLSTDNGRMFARIKGAVARAEIDRRSARQKRKGRQMAEAGESWGSRRAFGYQRDGQIVEREAEALRLAYEMILAGHSVLSIGVAWNEQGIRSTLGNTWSSASGTRIRKILMNPRNAGIRTYNGKEVGRGKWDPIVPEDIWRAARDILADPARRTQRSTGRVHLLVGIALCGECKRRGTESTMDALNAGRQKTPTYRCRTCFGVSRTMARTDEHVIDLVVARLAQPDAAELLVDDKRPDIRSLRAEVTAIRERLTSLAVDFAEGDLTKEQVKEATTRLKSKLAAAESAMEDANRARVFKGIVGEDAPLFRGLHLDRKRVVIDMLMTITFERAGRRGVFDPDTIVVDWNL